MQYSIRRGTVAPAERPAHLGDFTVDRRMLLITGWAVVVGAASAGTAWALLRLIGLITNAVFYQRLDTALVAPGAHRHAMLLVLLAPVAGGLVVGLMARFGSEKIRGHGMPEAIEAILTGGSRVAPRVAVLKPVSAAVSIGTGGPFGAEGPIIMTGGAVGSMLAQLLRLTADERKTLLVAGAAGGMAATFNSPLASVLLAVELLLFEWRPRSFVPVTAAAVVATVVRGPLLGTAPIFGVSTTGAHLSVGAEALCLVTGVTGGLLAVAATALVYLSEDLFAKLPVHWMWWPAVGGLIIGVGGAIEPRALGVGYDVIDQLLTGRAGLSLIVGILVVKTLIWSLALGSGTSGGVLAPMFMIGGALGALEGSVFPHVFGGFWAMIGLAAVVGGVMRSPLTGVVFTLELTHAWAAVLPLLVGSVTAYALSTLLLKRSVLTEKIARRGLHLTREYTTDPLETFFAADVMDPDARVLAPDELAPDELTADELAPDAAPPGAQRLFPVVSGGRLLGVVRAGAGADRRQLIADPVTVCADDTLRHVANVFAECGVTRAPVVSRAEPERYLGLIELADLLQARLHDLTEEHRRERHLRAIPFRRGRYPDRSVSQIRSTSSATSS
ncbi:MAG TPA: chloride channel protein [Jatrophihabitans sp.]|nr:chloride channel protein [Jatrophihabitans sp.]